MPKDVIVHSDRGSQYCPIVYPRLLESWNHSLKVEAIHGERFAMREMARAQASDILKAKKYF